VRDLMQRHRDTRTTGSSDCRTSPWVTESGLASGPFIVQKL